MKKPSDKIGYMKVQLNFTGDGDELCSSVATVWIEGKRYIGRGVGATWREAHERALKDVEERSGLPNWYLGLLTEEAEVQEPLL